MASALLATRQVPSCLLSQRRSARPSAFRSRPAPFTPARRVFARAQEPEDVVTVTDEELAELAEGEEDTLDAQELEVVAAGESVAADEDEPSPGFPDPADEGERFVVDEDDEDLLAALEAAELLGNDVDLETAAVVGVELDEDEDREDSQRALVNALAAKLDEDADVADEEVVKALSSMPEVELEEVSVEDFLPAMNSDRYAEVPLSAEDKAAIEPLKLSKSELRNLLPQEWDQLNVDFFSNKKDEAIPLPEFRLNILWKDAYLGVAIDQVYSRGQVSPLTEYFFWPRTDAWESLRQSLEAKAWISERDRIVLLNRLTQLINFWQDEQKKRTVEEARVEFPDCAFTAV